MEDFNKAVNEYNIIKVNKEFEQRSNSLLVISQEDSKSLYIKANKCLIELEKYLDLKEKYVVEDLELLDTWVKIVKKEQTKINRKRIYTDDDSLSTPLISNIRKKQKKSP